MERMRCRSHIAGMRLLPILFAVLLALAPALAPTHADARAGGGSSFGSRGSRTYVAPPATRTAPGYVAPLGSAPSYGARGYGGGSPFMRGIMGGLIGAGIAGLLFGGMHGIGGLFGLLIRILLVVWLVRWLLRLFAGRSALAGGGMPPGVLGAGFAGGMSPAGVTPVQPAGTPLAVQPEDYEQFEAALQRVQAAWSAGDIATLQRLTTPEMAATFAQQLQDLHARGLRNEVSDVRLLQGDLSEAWRENGADYATVAMRFSMIDVTSDASGRVVEGAPGEHVEARELWTFLRPPGGVWVLSAIQQSG
jgi:predicted lipid-binding transport protein (Tim44 family)